MASRSPLSGEPLQKRRVVATHALCRTRVVDWSSHGDEEQEDSEQTRARLLSWLDIVGAVDAGASLHLDAVEEVVATDTMLMTGWFRQGCCHTAAVPVSWVREMLYLLEPVCPFGFV